MIGSSEIHALVALHKFDKALELAYSIRITPTRIRLLSAIYSAMEKEGINVSRQSIAEVEIMVNSLKVNEIEPDNLVMIASDLFPLLPDLATTLVEKAKIKESERNPLDLFVLMTSTNSDDPDSEELISKIENRDVREFALVHSPWLAKLSATEVIKKANQIQNINAKIYLLQQWCIRNRKKIDVHLVMDAALNTIIHNGYNISLRRLRQLSEPLKFCNAEFRCLLIKRFEIPEFISLKSPFQERVRLELNFSEAIMDINKEEAKSRFLDTYYLVKSASIDTDITCYCLTRLLITLLRLDFSEKEKIVDEIKKKLEDEFISLLETSADQYEVTKKILKNLPQYDPELSLTFADMMNTVTRRDLGVQEVLVTYIKQDNQPICEDFINKGLSRIKDTRIKEQAILHLIETAKDYNKLQKTEIKNFFIKKIIYIKDPIILCKSIAYILSRCKREDDPKTFDGLFMELSNAWEKIDVIWMRVEAAFELTSIIAEGNTKQAEELFDRGRALRSTSPLAHQSIGAMFFETLGLASRAVGKLNLSNKESIETWEKLNKSIEFVPSSLLRSLLYAQLAIQRLKCGDKTNFDTIIQDKVIVDLQALPPSDLKDKVISDLALCIFEYSPNEVEHWIEKLPYSLCNYSWGKLATRIIFNSSLIDDLEIDDPNLQMDLASANKVLQIMEFIERDVDISIVGELFSDEIAKSGNLSEPQRLDFLVQLEQLVNNKLPDKLNIQHNGYKVVLSCHIERAIRLSAKKTRAQIKKKHQQIIKDALEIENIADRVFVMANVAMYLRDIEKEAAEKLMKEAFDNASLIPNLQDRADRYQIIAKGYSKFHKTDEACETLKIAKKIALSLDGQERDTVLAAIIQTAHQIDKTIGEQITEKIEDRIIQDNLDSNITASMFGGKHSLDTGKGHCKVDSFLKVEYSID